MVSAAFSSGLGFLRRRPGLTVLIFVIQLLVALGLAAVLADRIGQGLAGTGFDERMADGLEIGLLLELFDAQPGLLSGVFTQLFWMLPLLFVWHVTVGIGLTHAARDGGVRSFWTGVGRYFLPGCLLSLLFLVLAVVWIILMVIAIAGAVFASSGSVGIFWWAFVIIPTVAISGLAILDLMQDYARAALVIEEQGVFSAWLTGLGFPFRKGASSRLYMLWFIPALALWALPTAAEIVLGASVVIFLLQQVLLLGRAAVTVGWIGSEVSLYERVQDIGRPRIAEADEPPSVDVHLPEASGSPPQDAIS